MNKRFALPPLLAILVLYAAPAIADLCTAAPTLSSPTIHNVSTSGGTYACGSNDCIIDFPDGAAVTGRVTITGGKNVWIGGDNDGGGKVGGYIVLPAPDCSGSPCTGEREAIRFSNTQAGTKYFEGLHVDVNGNCDVFPMRNHLEADVDYTLVNNRFENMSYNIVDGNCHGDAVQNQMPQPGSGSYDVNIVIENLAVDSTDTTGHQTLFIPDRTTATLTATLENVYVRRSVGTNFKPVFWFASTELADPAYPVSLTNVWQATPQPGNGMPSEGSLSGGVWTYDESLITGSVNIGTDPNDFDLTFEANTGLNYDRDHFCAAASPPLNPVAAFTYSCTVLACTFTDASTDADATVDTWAWDFGDGDTSSTQSPSHNFPVADSYDVALTATDTQALSDTTQQTIDIVISETTLPTADITAPTGIVVVDVGQTITASVSDASGIYRVDFRVNGDLICSVLASPWECAWTPIDENIPYRLTASVTDKAGNTNEAEARIWVATSTVTNPDPSDVTPPTVSFVNPTRVVRQGTEACFQITTADVNGVWLVFVEVDGDLVGTFTEAQLPSGACWTPPDFQRHYTVVATSVDVAGNFTKAKHKVRARK